MDREITMLDLDARLFAQEILFSRLMGELILASGVDGPELLRKARNDLERIDGGDDESHELIMAAMSLIIVNITAKVEANTTSL